MSSKKGKGNSKPSKPSKPSEGREAAGVFVGALILVVSTFIGSHFEVLGFGFLGFLLGGVVGIVVALMVDWMITADHNARIDAANARTHAYNRKARAFNEARAEAARAALLAEAGPEANETT